MCTFVFELITLDCGCFTVMCCGIKRREWEWCCKLGGIPPGTIVEYIISDCDAGLFIQLSLRQLRSTSLPREDVDF